MSTRALIGKENEDGTVTAAWCWNDGKNIQKNLLKDFTKEEDLEFLLSLGEFNTIMTKAELDDYIQFCQNELQCDATEGKNIIQHNQSFILQDKKLINDAQKFFNIDDASGQDINVMYIMKNEQWLEYNEHPASEEKPRNLTEQQIKRSQKLIEKE